MSQDKKITVYPSPLRTTKKFIDTNSKIDKQKKSLHMISAKEFEKELIDGFLV